MKASTIVKIVMECAIVVSILSGWACVAAAQNVQLGVLGGMNLATINEDPDVGTDYSTLLGVGIGGVIDYNLNENMALRLEPMYLQKGSTAEESGFEFDIKLAYLELPVFLKAAFGENDFKPYVLGGGFLGYNMSAEVEGLGQTIDFEELIEDVDFGLSIGGGISIATGNISMFVEARYAHGLKNIIDDSDVDTEVKTRGIQLFGGITF